MNVMNFRERYEKKEKRIRAKHETVVKRNRTDKKKRSSYSQQL